MNHNNQAIKIYYSGSPHFRQFHPGQFKTMKDFQEQLKEWFEVEINNQKIIHNGKVLKIRGQTLFKQIQINRQSQLRLLTILPAEVKKLHLQEVIQMSQNVDQPQPGRLEVNPQLTPDFKTKVTSTQTISKIQKVEKKENVPQMKKEQRIEEAYKIEQKVQQKVEIRVENVEKVSKTLKISNIQKAEVPKLFLVKQSSQNHQQICSPYVINQIGLDRLITNFVVSLKFPNKQQLILNQSKLKFMLAKMSSANILLQKLLFQDISRIKLSLIDVNDIGNTFQIKQTYIQQQLADLKQFGFDNQNIIKALQLSRNNIEIALDILNKNNFQQYSFQFPLLKNYTLVEEYQTIFLWFIQPQNQIYVKLIKCSQHYLDIHLNYLKHASPDLYNILVRWYPFVRNLVLNLQKIPRKASAQ